MTMEEKRNNRTIKQGNRKFKRTQKTGKERKDTQIMSMYIT